jgi:hypothetical protein
MATRAFTVPVFLETLVPLLPARGILAIYAQHTQLDAPLTQTLVQLAKQGEHLAVIIADTHFDPVEIARQVNDAEHIKVARGETPHQVRHLVQRIRATHTSYSIAVVIGLLEPFYDEQVKWAVARSLLNDTLYLLNELALTLCVLVVITPAPKPTRPYLQAQVVNAVDHFVELPVLADPQNAVQARLL